MAIVSLKNSDLRGPVWVEARLSDGGVPYLDLDIAEGFPRWIAPEETVDIDIADHCEILFRRGMLEYGASPTQPLSPNLFRIGNQRKLDLVRAHLWEYPRILVSQISAAVIAPINEQTTYPDGRTDTIATWLPKRVVENKNYRVEPFYKASGYESYVYQIFLRVTELKTGKTRERLIIEQPVLTAFSLLDKLIIKSGNIIAKPRTSLYGGGSVEAYRSNGFFVPVTTPIALVMGK
jgi:hypothetical protein